MNAAEFKTAQDGVIAPVVKTAGVVLAQLPYKPLKDSEWAKLILLLFPMVARARAESVVLAREFYASLAPHHSAPDVPDPYYDPTALSKALSVPRVPAVAQSSVRDYLADPDHAEAAVGTGAAVVGHHAQQASREWTIDATSADDIRFGRYDPEGETCGFCRLLISRGPVYRSAVSGNFKSHPRCTCLAVPVFDENDWIGKDQYEAADALYRKTTVGKSGAEARNAFRRAVENPA
jgi:hypothetical protein